MRSRRKNRLPKFVAELLILIQFAVFFLLAVKLAFIAQFGSFGGFSNAEDAPLSDLEQVWSNTYEPFIFGVFICFLGFCIARMLVVMLWDKLKRAQVNRAD